MLKLIHFRLCPLSRSIRLALAERDIAFDLQEERAWEWRSGFLALNPAGELPVLEIEPGIALCGVYSISEYVAEGEAVDSAQDRRPLSLFPGLREDRAEVRRIVDWFHRKFDGGVSGELQMERVYSQVVRAGPAGGGPPPAPNPDLLRAIRVNLRYHLSYVSFLA